MSSKRPSLSQGAKANKQGRILEEQIKPLYLSAGFDVVSFREWKKSPENYSSDLLLTNAPYTSIYGHSGKTEFLLKSKSRNLEVRIECKWQSSKGSVDEKFPYLYLNCVEAMPEEHIIIVYGGGGMKAGAITWLKGAASGNAYQDSLHTKRIDVFTLEEFMKWTNENI